MGNHEETGCSSGADMMGFQCQMCGECCSTMGEIISIRKRTGDTRFRIGYSATIEERDVELDPDKADLFFSAGPDTTMACPFLRTHIPGRVICTVHHTRPDLCRQYSCFRILILDAKNQRAGRVMAGTRYFTASDPRLHEIWQKDCRPLDIPDEHGWEMEVERILTRAGYHIIL